MLEKTNLAFLGSGNMAKSIVEGLLAQNFPRDQVWVAGRNPDKLASFEKMEVNTTVKALDALPNADIVVLCVKPNQMVALCEEIKPALAKKPALIVSVAAGVSLPQLAARLGKEFSIVRAMPNTPCALGAGVIGLVANQNTSDNQKELAEALFRTTGLTFWQHNDDALNKVTALAGSGPAYVFLFMEALQNAAMNVGLTAQEADLMTKQTVLGAARMAIESDESTSKLRQEVTSKGGTTEAAISTLQESGFESIINDAFNAALARARFIESQLQDKTE